MPEYSYQKCYEILSLSDNCSWPELRKSYKQLIQKWHPDRFESSPQKKEAAVEKITHINLAYKKLASYYKKHGELPLQHKADHPSPQPPAKPATYETSTASAPAFKQRKRKPHSSSRLFMFSFAALSAFSVYFITVDLTDTKSNQPLKQPKTPGYSKNSDSQSSPAPKKSYDSNYKPLKPKKKFFTYNSSIGDVLSIQGPPDKTENNIWYYGDSYVEFQLGRVIGWKHSPNNPLRTKLDIPKINSSKKDINPNKPFGLSGPLTK